MLVRISEVRWPGRSLEQDLLPRYRSWSWKGFVVSALARFELPHTPQRSRRTSTTGWWPDWVGTIGQLTGRPLRPPWVGPLQACLSRGSAAGHGEVRHVVVTALDPCARHSTVARSRATID